MTLSVRQLLKDWQITVVTGVSLLLCLAQGTAIYVLIPISSNQFILRSSVYFGAVQIGSWWELFVPVAVVLGIVFLNFMIAFLLYEKNRVLSRFLSWFSLFLSLLLGGWTYIAATSKLIS